jgi:hypothetical protein
MTNKYIGRQEHTTAFYGFTVNAEGELIYTRSNDDTIDLQNDNQEENYRDYFIGISDGEFIVDDNGRLVFKY